jgi:hypothetical protein
VEGDSGGSRLFATGSVASNFSPLVPILKFRLNELQRFSVAWLKNVSCPIRPHRTLISSDVDTNVPTNSRGCLPSGLKGTGGSNPILSASQSQVFSLFPCLQREPQLCGLVAAICARPLSLQSASIFGSMQTLHKFSRPDRKVHFSGGVGSIPTAPTKTIDSQRLIDAFDTNKAFDTI